MQGIERLGKFGPLVFFFAGALVLLAVQTAWRPLLCPQNSLLNPALPCGSVTASGEWDYEPLRDTLVQHAAAFRKGGEGRRISVYFRDLNNGPRFGVGEYKGFQPASLMKLPVMIYFLHEADGDPSLLDKTLSFSGSLHTNMNVEDSSETIRPDTPYTIRELITKMIVYSDNYSYLVLSKAMNEPDPPPAYYTFRDLGVLDMMTAPNADYISIQSYASLFAILYNTGYLSREMSQFALETLSQATFRDGLAEGVPKGTVVAHKFGHKVLPDDEQLHDCGLVYHPKMTYVLCVMTSGADMATEEDAIAAVSRAVYKGVSLLHQ